MGAISNSQRAQRARRTQERIARNPSSIKRQLLREQRQRNRERTFHPFMRLPAELKLRVVQLADNTALKNVAASSGTMRRLWNENRGSIWKSVLRERYPLESRAIGGGETIPWFEKVGIAQGSYTKCERTAQQEAAIDMAAGAVVSRGYARCGCADVITAPSMAVISKKAQDGGFGYLDLLDEMKCCVETDFQNLQVFLASMGLPQAEDIRPAVMLLWKLGWRSAEQVSQPSWDPIPRMVYRKLDDDERVRIIAEELPETRRQFKKLLEALARGLSKAYWVEEFCNFAIAGEFQLQEQEGSDRHIPQFKALLKVEMENWLMREIVERPVLYVLKQVRSESIDFRQAIHHFCQKKINFMRESNLREMISETGVWKERQTDLISRMMEVLQ